MRRACPYRGENNGPGKDIHGELDPPPGIREQPGSFSTYRSARAASRMSDMAPRATGLMRHNEPSLRANRYRMHCSAIEKMVAFTPSKRCREGQMFRLGTLGFLSLLVTTASLAQ